MNVSQGTPPKESVKPLVVLVHEPSVLRLWMERSLSDGYRLCVFSGSDEALAFTRSTPQCDVLVTSLDFSASPLGGCNIAREVEQRFPYASILVFLDGETEDHRILILRRMRSVRFLSKPFGAFFLAKRIKNALLQRGVKE